MTTYGIPAASGTGYDQKPLLRPLSVAATDPSRLAPSDAIYAPQITPRANGALAKELRRKVRRTSTKSKKGMWKKLLWVKQSYPDNYTDEETFLDHLQRNPRLQPYEFWPLVASSAVIVQHVCSVIIFVCCFSGIVQERISPVTVVSTGSLSTVLGWALWDYWVTQAEGEASRTSADIAEGETRNDVSIEANGSHKELGLGIELVHPLRIITSSGAAASSSGSSSAPTDFATFDPSDCPLSTRRNRRRVATVKSAVLIYCALLGLSPILKSLTKSTTSDSIWAISFWLMLVNVFFFDYGGGPDATFTASLSTNAALMASTVLASRLTSTTHVFSLLLFSIEVFGLFPVFRRYLHHFSWRAHVALTVILNLGAGAGVALTVTGGGWTAAIAGAILGSMAVGVALGTCIVWLIGLQKYKNEIRGPWDPARPVIRRRWD